MTDHRFTDDDVIKMLKAIDDVGDCSRDCIFYDGKVHHCASVLAHYALEVIDRQKNTLEREIYNGLKADEENEYLKAEIESLNAVHADMTESLRLAAEANKDMQAEIKKLKGSRNRWKQIATDFDKASRETEKEIERLTTLAELGNMRANDYREMRNKLKKANAEIESLKKIGDDKTSEILRHDASIRELHTQLETARAEAIKEFAQRLREIARMPLGTLYGTMVYLKDIDTLEKEMTEENHESQST